MTESHHITYRAGGLTDIADALEKLAGAQEEEARARASRGAQAQEYPLGLVAGLRRAAEIVRNTEMVASALPPLVLVSRIDDPALMAVLTEVAYGLGKARAKHAPMHSPHEGWSVIWEELEELREHVRADTGRSAEARKEALQVAAMGLRYALDLCGPGEDE